MFQAPALATAPVLSRASIIAPCANGNGEIGRGARHQAFDERICPVGRAGCDLNGRLKEGGPVGSVLIDVRSRRSTWFGMVGLTQGVG